MDHMKLTEEQQKDKGVEIVEEGYTSEDFMGCENIKIKYTETENWKFDIDGIAVKIEDLDECATKQHDCPEQCVVTCYINYI